MTRLLLAILMILAAAALVAFAIANRTLVTVSFDPFDPTDPAYVATMPLYLLGFAILILGAIVGGIRLQPRQAAPGAPPARGGIGARAR
jgi:hypothetical protein